MVTIGMPKLSDSMEEGVLLAWLVDDGSPVTRGDEIAEIETDKATMTFEADGDGILHHAVEAGTSVPVGTPIAHLLADGESAAGAAGDAGNAGAAADGVPVAAGSVAAGPVAAAEPVAPVASPRAPAGNGRPRVKASPVARRIALAQRIDLGLLTGTGPGGRVVKADVEAALQGAAPVAPRAATPSVGTGETARAPAATATDGTAPAKGGTTSVALSRIQQTIARRMAESKSTIPDFAVRMYVDMDEAVALREQLRPHAESALPSYNDLVVKASALALRRHPRANGSYREGRFELHERVNVGIAVASEDALLVPTVDDADMRSIGSIARKTRELAEGARAGTLTAAQLSGGTFTVSNLGMYGVESFVAVINPPQAAILAVGAVDQVAVPRDGAVVIAHRMSLTLSTDHRILYGADAAEFLATIRDLLQRPTRLLL